MQECHDNILMKLSAVRVKTAAERNASISRTRIPITSSNVSSFANPKITFFREMGTASDNEYATDTM